MDTKPTAHYLKTMLQAYQECAEWSSTLRTDDGDAEANVDVEFDSVDNNGWHADDEAKALQECTEFAEANWADLWDVTAEQAGHDFWLTRNGHGAGFWDRGRGDAGRRLSDACKPYGEAYLWLDADGMVRCE